MLKLKRVEIHGFKSFFDKTELKFSGSGIAAVVGPNGCGKSNLSDAISWVLGEQSAKSLRGARMEDVIFAGTRDRKPLGMASVTMTLADPRLHMEPAVANGHSAPHPEEVTITRRLYRSGESEYLVNGKMARLRDIQDLFLGTGLGPESYAIIEQGRIGQILSNRPQDRRAVIEEAAGVGKFKTKKRLAEARLEGAKQNLTRVFDILEEVGRQVNSLKRQAAKAKRYEELKTEMVSHLRCSLTGKFRRLERDAAKAAIDLNLATQEFQTLSSQVIASETEHTALQETCYRTEAELTGARKALADLCLEQERTRGKLDYQAKQIGSIEGRLQHGGTETLELEKKLVDRQQELSLHITALGELERQTESARERLTTKSAEREKLQQALQERTRTLEGGRQQVLRLLGEASTLKNQLAQIEAFLGGMERDAARIKKDEQAATADIERLGGLKETLQQRVSARQTELTSVGERRRNVEQELNTRKQKAANGRRELDQVRTEASRLKARRDSLTEVLSHRSYTTESVKRLFTSIARDQAQNLKPVGVLADFVEVDSAYEKAAEEFLHEELEYVVVSDWEQAEQGISVMRSGTDGRATFLIHSYGGVTESPATRDLPEGSLGRLSDKLRLTNGLAKAPADLLPKLAHCFLADDSASAQRLAVTHPDAYFLLPDGVSYHGHAVSGGKKTGSGPLALKRELREVSGLVAAKQQALLDLTSLIEGLDKEIATLGEDLEQLRTSQQTQEKDALALDHEQRKLGEEFQRAQQRLVISHSELERLAKDCARASEQRDRNRQLVEEKELARAGQEQALDNSRSELEALAAEAQRVGEEHSALRAELAGFEERRRNERASQARFETQIREFAARREELGRELERLGVERARLLSDNIELDALAAKLDVELAASNEQVEQLAARETALRAQLSDADDKLKQLRMEVRTAQELRSQTEVGLVRLQAELKFLDETSRKDLSIPVEELSQGEETVPDEMALAEAEQRYTEVRARIDALGPVNTQAMEEYQEATQRYEFLNAQRTDLLDSIRDTEKTIQELEVESRKRFTEAYEVINAHFREMFQTLFGGGIGEMRLTDEGNSADSGIDIVASPPGKRLQNVLLLSGGEKSLTAMALLMAVFKYQPSPFCVLDEVDAPLDEANILRLTRLLQEMSGQTQFLVITHAKRTMEAAQALYGVTMQEPGVSKLVSVRLQPVAAAGLVPMAPGAVVGAALA